MGRYRILLAALVLFVHPARAAEATLKFSVTDSWSMPLIELQDYQPVNGILFDIMQSLARHMDRTAQYRVLPRLRVQAALERGDVDIRCYAAQAWAANLSGDFLWSLPILHQRDLLVASADTAAGPYPAQFDNETIGTVLGYNYPELQALFNGHQWIREDARSQEQVLRKLAAGRYHYAVSNQLALDWFNRQLPSNRQLKAISLINEQPAGCIVRNDPALPTQQILRTLVRMKVSGEIQQIIDRYSAPLNDMP